MAANIVCGVEVASIPLNKREITNLEPVTQEKCTKCSLLEKYCNIKELKPEWFTG